MKQALVSAINEIRDNKALFTLDEASIKIGVIQRLLSLLGWNTFDVNEVKPEYTVETKRVDFSLRINNLNKAFIEVKRPREELDAHQEQLLNYSFREGVKLSILTNGFTWWFYLPLNEGSWEERRFFTADFFEQDPEAISERFLELLSKENISSGAAVRNAENLYKSRQKKNILKEAIPRAWHKILSEPDDLFVELLIETTEKLSGFRPDITDIEKFLQSTPGFTLPKPEPSPARKRTGAVIAPGRKATADANDFINKKVRSFTLFNETYNPHTWKELLVTVVEEMYKRHAQDFDRCLSLRGSKMAYFSLDANELSQPKQIMDSKYFVETKLNSNSIVKRSRDLMSLFGYKESDLRVVAD